MPLKEEQQEAKWDHEPRHVRTLALIQKDQDGFYGMLKSIELSQVQMSTSRKGNPSISGRQTDSRTHSPLGNLLTYLKKGVRYHCLRHLLTSLPSLRWNKRIIQQHPKDREKTKRRQKRSLLLQNLQRVHQSLRLLSCPVDQPDWQQEHLPTGEDKLLLNQRTALHTPELRPGEKQKKRVCHLKYGLSFMSWRQEKVGVRQKKCPHHKHGKRH
jgi:hypothetical protein